MATSPTHQSDGNNGGLLALADALDIPLRETVLADFTEIDSSFMQI